MPAAPSLSVIIPSRDRPQLLRECLASLHGEDVELVVVDDGSREPLTPIAEDFGARCARQEPAGLNAARNTGIRSSSGEVVAFLDDDVVVERGWARALLDAVAQGADAVGGQIRLELRGSPPRWLTPTLRSYLAEYDLGPAPRWLDDDPVPVGANAAVRRDVLEQAGGFRSGLDRAAGSLVSNGDTELFRRLRAGGGRLRYEPAARVVHRIGPERLTLAYFRRRCFAQGVSDELIEDPDRGGRRARRLLRPVKVASVLGTSLGRGHGPVPALLWLDYCRGRFAAS